MSAYDVAIVGKGNIGGALAAVLRRKKTRFAAWDVKDHGGPDFPQAVGPAAMIFLCIPSWANREVARNIARLPQRRRLVLTLAKGIEEGTLATMEKVLRGELRGRADYGLFSGPMLAKDMEQGRISAGVITLSDASWRRKLTSLFARTPLRISFSSDHHGVALCAVLKNIYAVGLGMADALQIGGSGKGYLTIRAYQEMKLIVAHLGGRKKTVSGLAGLGDLLVTGWSGLSYNHRIGQEIIAHKTRFPKSEGCLALPSVAKMLGPKLQQFPFLHALKKIIVDQNNAKKTLVQFFPTV